MASLQIGNTLVNLVEQADSPELEITADGFFSVNRHWKAKYATCEAKLPALRDPDGFAGGIAPQENGAAGTVYSAWCLGSKLNRTGQSPKGGQWGEIRATYQGLIGNGTIQYNLEPSRYDRPIIAHPDFNTATFGPPYVNDDGTLDTFTPASGDTKLFAQIGDKSLAEFRGFIPGTQFAGVESYLAATLIWKKVSYWYLPPFTVTELFKIDFPDTGGFALPGTTSNWIKVDHSIRNMIKGASFLFELTEQWWYNSEEWLPEVYG
jgi:hypothetical protein